MGGTRRNQQFSEEMMGNLTPLPVRLNGPILGARAESAGELLMGAPAKPRSA